MVDFEGLPLFSSSSRCEYESFEKKCDYCNREFELWPFEMLMYIKLVIVVAASFTHREFVCVYVDFNLIKVRRIMLLYFQPLVLDNNYCVSILSSHEFPFIRNQISAVTKYALTSAISPRANDPRSNIHLLDSILMIILQLSGAEKRPEIAVRG